MIPVFRPFMGDAEVKAVSEVIRSRWIGLGPKTAEFEKRFAEYIGVKYAVAMNSGTAALHLALKVLGVEGGEVITTPMTFVSTNHAILLNGATPVFCDIEPDTLNIDASKIEALVTKKTRAILPVHYGGHSVDLGKVLAIAKKHRLSVVEDVAHGCGGEYRGRKLGSFGNMACYSFHAVKNLTTGDGGMVTTNDKASYDRLMKLRWVGISTDTWAREQKDHVRQSWRYDIVDVGYKYHMTDLAACIGLVQLAKLDKMNRRRGEIRERYNKSFRGFAAVETPVRRPYVTLPSNHNYVIKCDRRDELNQHLKEKGISTSVHYEPNTHFRMYRRFRGKTPVAEAVWTRLLTLPVYPELSNVQVDMIAGEVKGFLSS